MSDEKCRILAESNGWSLAHAEGFVDGESYRRRGLQPSQGALIAIDDYSMGFRAGYFERRVARRAAPAAVESGQGALARHAGQQRSA
jgi:hypothetical protein